MFLQIYNNKVQPFAEEISDLENENGIEDTNNNAINIEISDSDVETSLTGFIRMGQLNCKIRTLV